jgi:hypothetical protein
MSAVPLRLSWVNSVQPGGFAFGVKALCPESTAPFATLIVSLSTFDPTE